MEYKITGYKPEKLFHFFEEVCAVPRGSGNEKGISDFLVKFAKGQKSVGISGWTAICDHQKGRKQRRRG